MESNDVAILRIFILFDPFVNEDFRIELELVITKSPDCELNDSG